MVMVEAGAELLLGIGEKLDKIHDTIKVTDKKPVYKPVGANLVVPSSGTAPFAIIIPGPARGRTWNILKVVLAGADGHTTVANAIVDVFAGNQLDPNTLPSLDSLIVSGGTGNVPSITWYSKGVEWCSSDYDVIGLVYGAAAGATINLLVRVAEYEVAAVEAQRV